MSRTTPGAGEVAIDEAAVISWVEVAGADLDVVADEEGVQVPPSVVALRALMAGVQEEMRNQLAVRTAEHEAQAVAINEQFMAGVLNALPLTPTRLNNKSYRKTPVAKSVGTRPEYVQQAAASLIFLNRGDVVREGPALIVGEKTRTAELRPARFGRRSQEPKTVVLTDVLAMMWGVDKESQQPPAAQLFTFSVLSDHWSDLRNRVDGQLRNPPTHDQFAAMHHRERSLYELGLHVRGVDFPELVSGSDGAEKSLNNRNIRTLNAAAAASLTRNQVHGVAPPRRHLLRSDDFDFDKFDILSHIARLAAAFEVGDRIDELSAIREEALGAHPDQEVFGLPADYRQVVEGPNPGLPTI